MIDLQYADDISWITNHSEPVTEIEAPSKLEEKKVQVNNTKADKHDIHSEKSPSRPMLFYSTNYLHQF